MNDLLNMSIKGELLDGNEDDSRRLAGLAEIDYPDVGEVGLHFKARGETTLADEELIASLYLDPLSALALAEQLTRQAEESMPGE